MNVYGVEGILSIIVQTVEKKTRRSPLVISLKCLQKLPFLNDNICQTDICIVHHHPSTICNYARLRFLLMPFMTDTFSFPSCELHKSHIWSRFISCKRICVGLIYIYNNYIDIMYTSGISVRVNS